LNATGSSVVHNHLTGGGFGRRLEIDGELKEYPMPEAKTLDF
jgi:hypothetical protein